MLSKALRWAASGDEEIETADLQAVRFEVGRQRREKRDAGVAQLARDGA